MDDKISHISMLLMNKTDNNINSIVNLIIHKYNLEHSINTNGLFLNLSVLDEPIIDELYQALLKNYNPVKSKQPILDVTSTIPIINNKNTKHIIPDKINLEKFDKCLLNLSTHHLSI